MRYVCYMGCLTQYKLSNIIESGKRFCILCSTIIIHVHRTAHTQRETQTQTHRNVPLFTVVRMHACSTNKGTLCAHAELFTVHNFYDTSLQTVISSCSRLFLFIWFLLDWSFVIFAFNRTQIAIFTFAFAIAFAVEIANGLWVPSSFLEKINATIHIQTTTKYHFNRARVAYIKIEMKSVSLWLLTRKNGA